MLNTAHNSADSAHCTRYCGSNRLDPLRAVSSFVIISSFVCNHFRSVTSFDSVADGAV